MYDRKIESPGNAFPGLFHAPAATLLDSPALGMIDSRSILSPCRERNSRVYSVGTTSRATEEQMDRPRLRLCSGLFGCRTIGESRGVHLQRYRRDRPGEQSERPGERQS